MWGSNIIFTGSDLYRYYGVIKVYLSHRGLIVELPSDRGPFLSYILRPFPSTCNNSAVMLEGVEAAYIMGSRYQSSAIDYKHRCTLVHYKYVCDNKGFTLTDITLGGCEFQLTHDVIATKCILNQFPTTIWWFPCKHPQQSFVDAAESLRSARTLPHHSFWRGRSCMTEDSK